jgi:hypothetical protein
MSPDFYWKCSAGNKTLSDSRLTIDNSRIGSLSQIKMPYLLDMAFLY